MEQQQVVGDQANRWIREAVRLWIRDQAHAAVKYGHVSKWNTSQITDMSELFMNYKKFNVNISGWDMSNVTNTNEMFSGASSFNQDVSGWDVSNIADMSHMLCCASS